MLFSFRLKISALKLLAVEQFKNKKFFSSLYNLII